MIVHTFSWGLHRKYQNGDYPERDFRDGNDIVVAGEPRTHAQAITIARQWDSPQYRDRFLLREWLRDLLPSLDLHYLNGHLDCECARCSKRRAE